MKHAMGNVFAHLLGGKGKPKAAEGTPEEEDTEAAPGDEDDPDDTDEPDPEDPDEEDDDEPAAEDGDEEDKTAATRSRGAATPGKKPGKKSAKQQLADARKAGAKAERERCAAIFKDKAASGKPDMAAQLAFETDLSAEQAVGVLKTVKSGGSLDKAMNGVRQPNLGADGGNGDGEKSGGQKLLAAAKKRAEASAKR